jgi:sugar-specific transcriptional regulator TrmB
LSAGIGAVPAPLDRIVESLQELGLSLYETRLYLGLLTGGRQNGNELSRTSGVPSSKVYAMLERLAGEGIVARSRRGSTVEYVCVPPRDLLHKLRERYAALEYLEAPCHLQSRSHSWISSSCRSDAIVEHARALIRSPRRIILPWGRRGSGVALHDLRMADTRGVKIAGMLYGVDPPQVGWWHQHSHRRRWPRASAAAC